MDADNWLVAADLTERLARAAIRRGTRQWLKSQGRVAPAES